MKEIHRNITTEVLSGLIGEDFFTILLIFTLRAVGISMINALIILFASGVSYVQPVNWTPGVLSPQQIAESPVAHDDDYAQEKAAAVAAWHAKQEACKKDPSCWEAWLKKKAEAASRGIIIGE